MEWDSNNWQVHNGNKTVEIIADKEICSNEFGYTFINSLPIGFDDAVSICANVFDGSVSLPKNEEELIELEMDGKEVGCNELWVPLSDRNVEGEFRNIYSCITK